MAGSLLLSADSDHERILTVGEHLTKLRTRVQWHLFLTNIGQ